MLRPRVFIMLAMLVTTHVSALDFRSSPAVAEVFSKAKVNGTFVLYDVSTQRFIGYDQQRAEERFIPASTFKIPNSLIGLSAKAVNNVDEVLYRHDGKPKILKSWERDMGLREAMQTSNVGAFQVLARRVGLKAMQDNVRALDYGNADIGKSVDMFWLQGPLKISAVEQALFLARLAQGQLPYSASIQADVREIIKLEAGSDWVLYGKTGWVSKDNPGIGWLVGWVEQDHKIYSFALNIDVPQDTVPPALPSALSTRPEIAKASLRALGLLQAGTQDIKRVQVESSDVPVLQAVVIPPNASIIQFSGMLPEVRDKEAPRNSPGFYGDTEAQTVSVLRRIEAALTRQGLGMGEIVQLTVFLVGDSSLNGAMEFSGFQAGYRQLFSTQEQPNKPVRSVLQIAGLPLSGALVEIEATAAKVK